jgi:hypothetical protein
VTTDLTSMELALIERSAAHSMAEAVLTEAARFQNGVTDLDVALVMRALEGGTPFSRTVRGRWFAPVGAPVNGNTLSTVVNECIRTGLMIHYRTGVLIPAMVHLKRWDQAMGRWTTHCDTAGENMGPKRVRLHDDALMVDCLACLDRL